MVYWQSLRLDLEFSCKVLDFAFNNIVLAFALDFAKGARKELGQSTGSLARIWEKPTWRHIFSYTVIHIN